MKDPHVSMLRYTTRPSENASFEEASPSEGVINGFRYRLDQTGLVIEPTDHFATVDEARAAIEPILRSWEIDIALQSGSPELSFDFRTAHVVDRDPPPGAPQRAELQTQGMASAVGSLAVKVTRKVFPSPPMLFRTNPDVETLWHRYEGYRSGRELLPSTAYFCLTMIQPIAGDRSKAARLYRISAKVLSKLGTISSEHGDPSVARKYRPGAQRKPLTGPEIDWLKETLKAIIRRTGELHSDQEPPEITMADLPPL